MAILLVALLLYLSAILVVFMFIGSPLLLLACLIVIVGILIMLRQ